ncbi:unnamed protein product [Arctia plantaginis]|uniref:Spherulin-2A n=1 Tax=Arctia plantaginis TaxID=874455 RepID=A0A8S0YWL1_ARCPL|nr:unnamed protein product [Arctia plantaginis]CAB3255729.1 unnamed protein product [Arctia plantaginis]
MNALAWLVLLALPALILASISIDIIASEDKSEPQVHISGSEVNVISDIEIESFKLYDNELKRAVNADFGATPNDVFLKSPTPWNDLYKKYGWTQVTRIFKPIRAKILSVKYNDKLVSTQVFRNPSTKVATYRALIRHDVEDTIASIWETNEQLSTDFNISYGTVIGKASVSYTSRWGENVMKSQTVTVGYETGIVITLQPNQNVQAELYATRGAITVQIDYEATLDGYVAVNYAAAYRRHHFYGLDINEVLSAGNMKRSLFSSENITLSYYLDSEVVLHDYDTNDILYFPNLV